MAKVYYAVGPGARLTDVLGADDSIRSQIPGDVHLVSVDGKAFYPFFRRPESADYAAIEALAADDSSARPLEFARGIVKRAMGDIEEIEV